MNHTGAGDVTNSEVEFGTVEASLLSSVATILGIHGGNITLYQEQADFFASVVRALTSAIDAKDPYTCGHSDRVARLSVCLARRLGCTDDELDTIYLSGLLHDIGKIGIDDNVLRKPGALTEAELEHIKTHPRLGCKILDGVKQLDKVLPVVLHHHEAWDGGGYPEGLKARGMPEARPDRGGGRFDRRDVERPSLPQRHSRREAGLDPPRRSRPAMGCQGDRCRVPGPRRDPQNRRLRTGAARSGSRTLGRIEPAHRTRRSLRTAACISRGMDRAWSIACAGVMLVGMAREEHDREDLLREATALVERIELAPFDDAVGRARRDRLPRRRRDERLFWRRYGVSLQFAAASCAARIATDCSTRPSRASSCRSSACDKRRKCN